MPSIRIISLPVVALCAALVGCNENQKTAQDDILRQNDDLTKELASKNDSLNSMGEQLSRLQQINTDLEAQLAECNRLATERPAAEPATVADARDFHGIEGVEATVEGDDIHLTIANSLLFDSGKTALKDGAKRSLDKIAAAIKEKYAEREVMVVGHTDTDPIKRTAFASNYHLGFERAYAVRGYLDRKGVTGAHMGLVSFGPDRPEASKDRSRRVEVIVTGTAAPGPDAAVTRAEAPKNEPKAASKAPAKSSRTTK
jgi:flagellar motor protein MotB